MRMLTVVKKEFRENLRKKRIFFSAFLFIAICLFVLISSISGLKGGNLHPDLGEILIIYFIFIVSTIISFIPFIMISQEVVFVEKMKKGYENILATPLSIQDLILGKSLFLFLFAYPLVLLLMLIYLRFLSINYLFTHFSIPFFTLE